MDFVKSEKLVYKYTYFNEENEKLYYTAIDNLNLNIKKGDFVAVLGHNGSGKSTFAKHINALLKPTEGTLWVNGINTCDDEKIWDIRKSAGMVFQNPDNQIIATIVEEDIAFGPENLGMESDKIRENVDKALQAVSMTQFRHSAPNFLSGGQKQRIAIAGILAMKPECIILDEPTAMLDPVGRKEVIDTITELNKNEKITIILITHYMEEACLANRVVVMEKGNVVMDDVPERVFRQVEKMKKLRLDVPQVTELAYRLNRLGYSISDSILSIDEMVKALNEIGFDNNVRVDIAENKYTAPKPFLEIKNLTHIYGKETAFERVALRNVSLSVGRGEFIGLIGHTGSGKSTLIQHLNALAVGNEGGVYLDGVDINADKTRLKSIRQRVGLVFQYPEHQLFETTIYKDVAFGPKNLGLSQEEIDRRVKNALSIVGMDESYYEKSPFELSGGQKRRVAIAGVLAMEPEVLVLDEPTAGLDPYGRDEILNNVKKMHKELGITVILVSHSMEDVSKLADRIIVMNSGSVEFFDTPENVYKNTDRLMEIGLNAPQISVLMSRLNKLGACLPENIYTVESALEILTKVLRK